MKIKSVTQIFPITLLGIYMTLFFFTSTEVYNQIYDNIIVRIDVSFFIISVLGAIFFFKHWNVLAKASFVTVLLLNILTELSFEFVIVNYYSIYQNIVVMFFLFIICEAGEKVLN